MAMRKGILLCFLLSFIVRADAVKCPNPATNCISETYNGRVFPVNGCIGCTDGCKPGFIVTSNYKYYNNTDATISQGYYTYQNINISNAFNIYEPEWICLPGDTCKVGYYLGKGLNTNKYCAWCGEGCRQCSKYEKCDVCFGGYRRTTYTVFGKTNTRCDHSNVLCPTQPKNCEYKVYVIKGSGCIGCQLCESGYTVTFNPKYIETNTNRTTPYYDYKGLSIRDGINVNEPRYICKKGTTCEKGFYKRIINSLPVCEWCGEGCTSCTDNGSCKACASSHILSSTGKCLKSIIG